MVAGNVISYPLCIGDSSLVFWALGDKGVNMDPEDLEPRKKQAAIRALEPMSVEELEEYIGELEGEIARVRLAISAKKSVRSGAESLFRK